MLNALGNFFMFLVDLYITLGLICLLLFVLMVTVGVFLDSLSYSRNPELYKQQRQSLIDTEAGR